ncbi:MAG: VOC family protein [Anaerolineales bacterium]|uniref:VOC family protein n=1 Tax=Candidatus Villigracilis proximus TaxID=3140683 RepID=UPI0031349A3E|nr:VOC family protein [Anaerolineales bacterium]
MMSKRNIVHVEIPAVNVEGAGKFYESLFGWKLQHMPEMNYTMWEAGDGTGGGFPEASAEYPAGQVLVYIDSDDIDADLKMVEKLGGQIVKSKTEIPGMGWCGIFKDPTGNVLALYTGQNSAN